MRGISFSSNRVGSVVEGGHPALKSARSRIYAPKYIRVVIFVARKDKFPSVSVNNARNGGIREETLVVWTLVELVDRVDVSHSREIVEDNLVGSNANHRAVLFEERLDCLALLETHDVDSEPDVGNRGVPGTRDSAQGRQKCVVDGVKGDVRDE